MGNRINSKAYTAMITFSDGSRESLDKIFSQKPTLLTFLRHFGWPFCRKHVAQLRDNKEKIEKTGLRVVLTGMGDLKASQKFKQEMDFDFKLISDPEKKLYQQYELRGGSLLNMLSPRVLMRGLSAMAQGHKLDIPHQDPEQLGGDFVIDTEGIIRWKYLSKDPSDNAPMDLIIQETEKLDLSV